MFHYHHEGWVTNMNTFYTLHSYLPETLQTPAETKYLYIITSNQHLIIIKVILPYFAILQALTSGL